MIGRRGFLGGLLSLLGSGIAFPFLRKRNPSCLVGISKTNKNFPVNNYVQLPPLYPPSEWTCTWYEVDPLTGDCVEKSQKINGLHGTVTIGGFTGGSIFICDNSK